MDDEIDRVAEPSRVVVVDRLGEVPRVAVHALSVDQDAAEEVARRGRPCPPRTLPSPGREESAAGHPNEAKARTAHPRRSEVS